MAQYGGFFKGWEIAVAKNLVNEFQNKYSCLIWEDFDDLLQECLIHWCLSRKDYDPEGEASRKTFMGRIIRRKLTDIIREREADKRRAAHLSLSLDEYLSEGDETHALIDEINKGAINGDPHDYIRNIQLKMDIAAVLQDLCPYQQELCRLLGEEGLSVNEVSGCLKKSRRAIYEEIQRIRTIFKKKGLRGYLK